MEKYNQIESDLKKLISSSKKKKLYLYFVFLLSFIFFIGLNLYCKGLIDSNKCWFCRDSTYSFIQNVWPSIVVMLLAGLWYDFIINNERDAQQTITTTKHGELLEAKLNETFDNLSKDIKEDFTAFVSRPENFNFALNALYQIV